MKAKHTPGPWYAVGAWVEHEKDDVADICNCDPESMSQGHLGRSYDEMAANARLIAAAPDLLKACEAIWKYDQSDCETDNFVDLYEPAMALIQAAIGRAKGE